MGLLDEALLGRTLGSGWRVEAVSINESSPVEPGTRARVAATATNVSDDSDNRLDATITVNGDAAGTVTFEAAVTGVDSEAFRVTVPSGVSKMRVCVDGECDSISVGTTDGGDGGGGGGGGGGDTEPTFDAGKVNIVDCGFSPGTIESGEGVTFSATVSNDNSDFKAAFDLVFTAGIFEGKSSRSVGANSTRTFTSTFDLPLDPADYNVQADLRNLRGV